MFIKLSIILAIFLCPFFCLRQASSGCKSNIRCHNTGSGQYFCGPYQISWAYWADAGKPGSNGFSNDFENCLVDRNCAEAAVRGYMSKYGNVDCIGPNDIPDSEISCFDYAAIHKLSYLSTGAFKAKIEQEMVLNLTSKDNDDLKNYHPSYFLTIQL